MTDTSLLERLGSTERPVQRAACNEALGRLRAEPRFQDELRALLRDGSPLARFAAAFTLFREGGRVGLGLLPPLLASLDLADGDLRWEAAHMLAVLGRMHGEIFPVLLHEARAGETAVRRRMALFTLRELAPERDETRAVMLAALDDQAHDVRAAALTSLAKLHDPGRGVLDRVLSLLARSNEPRVRRIAASLLPELAGRCAAEAEVRAPLERATQAIDPALARAAENALRRLGAIGEVRMIRKIP